MFEKEITIINQKIEELKKTMEKELKYTFYQKIITFIQDSIFQLERNLMTPNLLDAQATSYNIDFYKKILETVLNKLT